MSAPNPSIYHEELSTTFNGIRHSASSSEAEVWQFRGIKYGNIPARFRQSVLNTSFPNSCDTSAYGPQCPQAIAPRLEQLTIGLPPHLASHPDNFFDEFNCLHLNVTAPSDIHDKSSLPVMVYVHGGGGYAGANSDWWCDGGSLVKNSIQSGKPVVMISVNYRLTALGYIGSSELLKENGSVDGGNYGLRDIHTALAWIQRYIKPLGGNPDNVTLYGESAGSLAVHAQMKSLLPAYFIRCILQSQVMGAPPFSTPQSVAEKTVVYEAVKKHLNTTTLAALEAVAWEKLVAAYEVCDPKHALGEQVMLDGEFMNEDWAEAFNFAKENGELIIGNTGSEGAVITAVSAASPAVEPKPGPKAFITSLNSFLPLSKLTPILDVYKVSPSTSGKNFTAALLAIIEDVIFYKPASDLAVKLRSQSAKVYEYSFEQPQPFGGDFKGVPGHALDLAYLHGDPSIFAQCENPDKELAIQHALQSAWIGFANGEKPWDENDTKIFGPEGNVTVLETGVVLKEMRRGAAWKALDLLEDEKTAFIGVVFGFYAQLVGSGRVY
ncbi:Lipase 1 [Hyphodiscus hymeniophilus]|uniref:Lipase 1 n=1 Tax=Hyphodiscus hymeniophilus TaxID=353542 RepID=A0A9P7AVR8_9HELO|nr:Lipase 1 [Hyphodiscus hymeniophilus]